MAQRGRPRDRTPYTGTRIPARLDALGWSVAELARRMGYNRSVVSSVLSGRLGISWQFVGAACRALDETPERLFIRADDAKTDHEEPTTDA